MLDQKDRHLELFSDELDGLHQFLRLVGVHACCRFVQKKQFRVRRQSPGNLQLSLFSVGKVGGVRVRIGIQLENFQDL